VCVQASEKKKEGRVAGLSAELKGTVEEKAAVGKALEDAKRLLREAMQERTHLQEAPGDKEAQLEQAEGSAPRSSKRCALGPPALLPCCPTALPPWDRGHLERTSCSPELGRAVLLQDGLRVFFLAEGCQG